MVLDIFICATTMEIHQLRSGPDLIQVFEVIMGVFVVVDCHLNSSTSGVVVRICLISDVH